jgi:multicomponent Na+:H+ antiporter subunit F
MTLIELTLIEWVAYITLAILSLAIGAAFLRVLQGPSLPDRVVALDLVAYLAMGFLASYAVLAEQETYIDAALVLGLLAFVGTVAVARYIERVESNQPQENS